MFFLDNDKTTLTPKIYNCDFEKMDMMGNEVLQIFEFHSFAKNSLLINFSCSKIFHHQNFKYIVLVCSQLINSTDSGIKHLFFFNYEKGVNITKKIDYTINVTSISDGVFSNDLLVLYPKKEWPELILLRLNLNQLNDISSSEDLKINASLVFDAETFGKRTIFFNSITFFYSSIGQYYSLLFTDFLPISLSRSLINAPTQISSNL